MHGPDRIVLRRARARGLVVGLLIALLHASSPTRARADDATQRAGRAFADGERAFAAGEYGRAAALFEEANAASPHVATLWNAARSRHLAGDLAKAANLYVRFLHVTNEAKDRDEAKAQLGTIERYLGRVTVKAGGARAAVDGAPIGDGAVVYVDPGAHRVEAGVASRSVRVAAGESIVVDFDAEPAPSPSPAPPKAGAVEADEGRRSRGLPPIVPVVAGGATLVVTAVTVWSGLDLLAQRRQWDQSGSNADLDVGLQKQTRTNVLIGVSIGLGVVTGVLALLTDWHAPLLGGDGSGAPRTVGFRF